MYHFIGGFFSRIFVRVVFFGGGGGGGGGNYLCCLSAPGLTFVTEMMVFVNRCVSVVRVRYFSPLFSRECIARRVNIARRLRCTSEIVI